MRRPSLEAGSPGWPFALRREERREISGVPGFGLVGFNGRLSSGRRVALHLSKPLNMTAVVLFILVPIAIGLFLASRTSRTSGVAAGKDTHEAAAGTDAEEAALSSLSPD